MNLFEYGILSEQSDIRAHVSVCNQHVYVFQTSAGRDAVLSKEYRVAKAYQKGVTGATAEGWLVPIIDIKDIRSLFFKTFDWHLFDENETTTHKGECAAKCVIELFKRGRFPLWIDALEEADNRTMQISGTDLLVVCNKRIQIKCDWNAGKTGNLYLQKAERNPLNLS